MRELELVYPVFVIWLAAAVVGWVFILGAMLPPTGLTFAQLKGRDNRARTAVKLAMRTRLFWVGFWGSLVCVVVNTLAPLGLIGSVPIGAFAAVMALNVASNAVIAIPLRGWLWKIHLGIPS